MPRWLLRLRLRLRSLVFRSRVERELQEEIQYHLARGIAERLAAGVPEDEARVSARLSMGAIAQNVEACRDMRGLRIVDQGMQDLRFAIRQFSKHPAFAGTAILMIGLGLAASVAIFGFVEAALIHPLPYRDQATLASVFGTWRDTGRGNLSYLDYVDIRERNQTFSSIDVYDVRTALTLTTANGAERVIAPRVSHGFFRTLGVAPVLGRDFQSTDEGAGAPANVLVTDGAWQSRFGGREDVLGQTLTLNGQPHVVIGVLPRDFHFAPAGSAEFWVTLRWTSGTSSCWQRRGCRSLLGIARLPSGLSIPAASSRFAPVIGSLRKQYPESDGQIGVGLVPLRDAIVGEIRPVLLVLIAAAGLLLLIAGINVMSLLLARSDSRTREIAVRNALGASSARLIVQFATEAFVLVAAGGAVGLILAAWAMRVLTSLLGADMLARMPYLTTVGLNLHLMSFAGLVLAVGAAVFALTPMTRISRSARLAGLKEGSRGSAGTTWRRFGAYLVVAELALAVVLLVSAGLLGKSLYRLLGLDIGLNPEHLLTLSVGANPGELSKDESLRFSSEIAARVSAMPGVTAVGYADQLPLGPGIAPTSSFWVSGRSVESQREDAYPVRRVSAGYFNALQARLLRGRYFTDDEVEATRPVMIVNETTAQRYFPDADPIGQSISFGRPNTAEASVAREIVGVIADIKDGPLEMPSLAAAYVPFDEPGGCALAVRTSQPDSGMFPSIAAAIRELRPGTSISGQMTMIERINRLPSAHLHRSSAWVVGGFAAMAFVLSVVGLYGVVSYSVGQRRREIGVRMALGAAPTSVYRLVIGEAAWFVGAGVALGTVSAVGVATMMRGLLFGVRSWDVQTLTIVCGVLTVSALIASYAPARRAASVDPLEVLRAE